MIKVSKNTPFNILKPTATSIVAILLRLVVMQQSAQESALCEPAPKTPRAFTNTVTTYSYSPVRGQLYHLNDRWTENDRNATGTGPVPERLERSDRQFHFSLS